jgi:hypothetical protein
MGKPLSEDLIKMRGKTDNLALIENLNLWGSELNDVSLLRDVPNVRILSLSVNHLDTLKYFASLTKLQELYMRRNAIKSLSEINYLTRLKDLRILWLSENPICSIPFYREFVIKSLPSLTKLDDKAITDDERRYAASINMPDVGQPETIPSRSNFEVEAVRQQSRGQEPEYGRKKPTTAEFIEESDEDFGYRQNNRIKTYQSINENPFGSRNPQDRSVYQSYQNPIRDQIDPPSYGQRGYGDSNIPREDKSLQGSGANIDRNQFDNLGNSNLLSNAELQQANSKFSSQKRQDTAPTRIQNENILTAILVLMNELTPFEIQILKNECDKKLA